MNEKIRQLLKNSASGNAMLHAQSYTNPDHHDLEMALLFEKSWMAIGFISELPKPGMAKPMNALGKSLLVTRDQNDQFHVFANVCRHRGHVLLQETCHKRKLLTCPYHAWSYDLGGRFVAAPFWDGTENSSPSPQEKEKMGLLPIAFEIWYDILFVNFSGDAEPFEKHILRLQTRWQPQRPSSLLRCFYQKSYSISGNWKLVAENFLDNYHLPWIHPEVGNSMEASLGLEVENQQLAQHIIGFTHPTAGKEKSKTEKPLPCWPGQQGTNQALSIRQDLFFIFPNTCFVMEGNYLWSMILMPQSVERCEEKLALYVITDKALSNEFAQSRNQLATVIDRINQQDASVIRQLQLGRQLNAASQGIFNPRHDQVGQWFHQNLSELILSRSETNKK
ncbi:MAG: Rieske 2Fe-2S domain-containing protein [Gammaproteobacteria bacterium]|nr:Rieske 2Fe-2S domain-containing protein [Gammaproteobacteria bacterium]